MDKQERFAKAWEAAKNLRQHHDRNLVILLAAMADMVDVCAEMANEDKQQTTQHTSPDEWNYEAIFNMATDMLEDEISRENLEFYLTLFAEQMKAFNVKPVVMYKPSMPSPSSKPVLLSPRD